MVTPMLTLLLDNVDCSSQHYLVLLQLQLQMQLQQLPWEWTITWILDFIADCFHFSTNHACRNNFKSDINSWYLTFTVATCKVKNLVVSPKQILIITFDFHLNHSILFQWGIFLNYTHTPFLKQVKYETIFKLLPKFSEKFDNAHIVFIQPYPDSNLEA